MSAAYYQFVYALNIIFKHTKKSWLFSKTYILKTYKTQKKKSNLIFQNKILIFKSYFLDTLLDNVEKKF